MLPNQKDDDGDDDPSQNIITGIDTEHRGPTEQVPHSFHVGITGISFQPETVRWKRDVRSLQLRCTVLLIYLPAKLEKGTEKRELTDITSFPCYLSKHQRSERESRSKGEEWHLKQQTVNVFNVISTRKLTVSFAGYMFRIPFKQGFISNSVCVSRFAHVFIFPVSLKIFEFFYETSSRVLITTTDCAAP